ncbi:MAG: hypothetical protein WCJ93_06675 [Methanomicrobiales archaeon]
MNNGGNTIGGNSVNTGAVNHNSVTSASAACAGGGAGGGSNLVVSDVTEASPASAVSDQDKGTVSEEPGQAVLNNGPAQVTQVATKATPANADMARVASQAPGSSIFSLFIEVAAMISVILIVVISVSLRYREGKRIDW